MRVKDFILPCKVSMAVLRLASDGSSSLERCGQEGDVAVLFVTGDVVGSRRYDASDPIVRRIESNAELYVSVHDDGTVDYVRKAVVETVLAGTGIRIVAVVVCRDVGSVDMDAEVQAARRKSLTLSAVWQDMSLVDYLASRLLKRILLPVLLVYLAVLLVNFFVHSQLTERLGEVRSAYAKESVEAKKRSAVTQAQARLLAEYAAVPEVDFARLSDQTASRVTEDIRLTSLVFDAPQIKICGDAFTSVGVMSFVDSLRRNVECGAVNLLKLEKDAREDLFKFEIQMMP